eukprot:2456794-Rhodomonas_salina.2
MTGKIICDGVFARRKSSSYPIYVFLLKAFPVCPMLCILIPTSPPVLTSPHFLQLVFSLAIVLKIASSAHW